MSAGILVADVAALGRSHTGRTTMLSAFTRSLPTLAAAVVDAGAPATTSLPAPFVAAAAFSAFALGLTLFGELRGPERLAFVFKPLASLGFLVAAWAVGALQTAWGTAVFAGLVLSAFGDVFLLSRAQPAFLAGLVAFLLGHVAYLAAFVIRGVDLGAAGLAALPLFAIALAFLRWIWPRVDAPMRAPVLAYLVVITTMVVLAVGSHSAASNAAVVVGAVLFWLSDMSVAYHRFFRISALNRLWGLPCYYVAQFVLAAALLSP